jgi:hypothetical protein
MLERVPVRTQCPAGTFCFLGKSLVVVLQFKNATNSRQSLFSGIRTAKIPEFNEDIQAFLRRK